MFFSGCEVGTWDVGGWTPTFVSLVIVFGEGRLFGSVGSIVCIALIIAEKLRVLLGFFAVLLGRFCFLVVAGLGNLRKSSLCIPTTASSNSLLHEACECIDGGVCRDGGGIAPLIGVDVLGVEGKCWSKLSN